MTTATATHGRSPRSSCDHGTRTRCSICRRSSSRPPGVQVALTGQTLRRVSDRMAAGGRLMDVLVAGVVLLTLMALLLSVYGSSLTQSREVAILRVLGARRSQIVGVVLLMTLSVVLLGILSGMGVAAALARGAEGILRNDLGLDATVRLLSSRTMLHLGGLAVLLAVVGAQPALAAYRVQAAEALSEIPGAGRAARSQLTQPLQLAVALAVVLWISWAMARHSAEQDARPLESSSATLFEAMATREGEGARPKAITDRLGGAVVVEGYMYALGDPFVVEDFYMVAINPRLPRCPFCYRAPTRRERILVRSSGQRSDLCSSLVRVRGHLRIDEGARDPYVLDLDELEVVIP